MDVVQYGDPDAPVVLIQPADEHDLQGIENEIREIRKAADRDFRMLVFRIRDWNRELSPWSAPPVFGSEPFGSGAQETLREILNYCRDPEKTYYIGGYSLAGLFALWTAYQTEVFSGVAAASPSLWFPGFLEYMKMHPVRSGAVYLSLGDKEEKTRNPVMATVGERIREACDTLLEAHVDCILEWNEENHFREADVRTAKAFAWLMRKGK